MSDTEEETKIQADLGEISLDVAEERKQEGNDLFRAGKWEEALVGYRSALGCLPKRSNPKARPRTQTQTPPTESLDGENENEDDGILGSASMGKDAKDKGKGKEEADIVEVATPAVSEAEKDIKQLRATLNANIGACYVKQGEHKEAVESCTEALLDDPTYVKALERRATCNDMLNTWSSLTSAQEDYNKVLTLITSTSQSNDIRGKLYALKPRLEAAQKRETDEMLSKLKGLGNSLLGNFGLSTDNFQFVPNGQGGYSLNFKQ